ncbi:MAG: hypothetical protein U0T77_09405 [Chitinophagales bacterium]
MQIPAIYNEQKLYAIESGNNHKISESGGKLVAKKYITLLKRKDADIQHF